MFHLYHKSIALAVSGLLLAIVNGCQAPSFARSDGSEATSKREVTASNSTKPDALASVATAADDNTVATVMQEVQQISAKDPASGKILLGELSRSEPKLWPLVLQQFRSQQAYHEQLTSRPKKKPAAPAAEIEDVVSNDRPSEELGKLADPRRIRNDAAIEQAFAKASPANMPAPIDPRAVESSALDKTTPATFADIASAKPLATEQQETDSNDQVVQVSTLDRNAAVSRGDGVQQAILSTDVKPSAQNELQRDWQQHLTLAVDDLSARLADGPRSTAEVHQIVSLRLLQLLAGQTEAALQPIPDVSTQEQDYWSGQIFALATFLDHHRQPDDERRAAASVVHLDEAVGHLRELGTLSLRNLAFCKHVYGYGAYEPINAPTFAAGQQVTLYLEVENYHSESTQKGYATKLGANYEVVDEAGERMAGGEFPKIEDCCQSRRRDFHIQYGLVLPKAAKAGKYHLKLIMDDRQSDKMGTATIAFDIR